MKKKVFLLGLALFLTFVLVACGNDATETETDTEPTVTAPSTDTDTDTDVAPADTDTDDTDTDVVEGPGHATSRGGITTEEALIEALSADSPERAWVAGLASDIEMAGPLYLAGEAERHSAGNWSGVPARKLGFYIRDEVNGVARVPVGAWSLTVENGIIVNSPQAFFISDGPFIADVYADVYVNIPYFRLSGVRVHGDLIFANEHYRDTAVFQIWDSEVAHIDEGDDADYETEFVLYRSNTGFQGHDNGAAFVSSSDATANVSNTDPSNLVTGEIRIAE